MLPHYSPYKVAETFTILAGLYPGRIDLGLGRAPGTDPLTMYALQRDRRQAAPDDFPQQLAELLGVLRGRAARGPPVPRGSRRCFPGSPSCRTCGCSAPRCRARSGRRSSGCRTRSPTSSTRVARTIARVYRERFAAERGAGEPRTAVAAWVLCAPTDEEAQELAASSRMTLALLRRGQLIPVPPRDEGARVPRVGGAGRSGPLPGRRGIIGSPEVVRAGLESLASRVRRRRGDRRHDHARPRRAPALVRADRRRVGWAHLTPATTADVVSA